MSEDERLRGLEQAVARLDEHVSALAEALEDLKDLWREPLEALRADIASLRKQIMGGNGDGLIIRVDRLEQNEKRRDKVLAWAFGVLSTITGGGILYAIVGAIAS